MTVSIDVFIVRKSSGGADRLTEKTDINLLFLLSSDINGSYLQFLSGPLSDIFFVVCISREYSQISQQL